MHPVISFAFVHAAKVDRNAYRKMCEFAVDAMKLKYNN